MSAGSGPTSLSGPATHVPMLLLATTTATTWCPSCPSIETETTSCPTRLSDMSMPTCWTPVRAQLQACLLTEFLQVFLFVHQQLILSVSPQARDLCRRSWRPTSSRRNRSGSGYLGPGSLEPLLLHFSLYWLFSLEGSGGVTRRGRGHRATERDSHCCTAAQKKVHHRIRPLCNTQILSVQLYVNVQWMNEHNPISVIQFL